MFIGWVIDIGENTCDWIIKDKDSQYSFQQSIDMFFSVIEQLHAANLKMNELIGQGMSKEAAIAEWERMIKDKG